MPKSTKRLSKIYLDYSSGVEPNPSTIHSEGQKAKKDLENARREVARILHARPEEIIFTSGGTESNNIAIQGCVFASRNGHLPHIITTNIEHPSVLETFHLLKKRKLTNVSIVPVEPGGIVDPKKIIREINKHTVLVSVMYANNEIGTIQPIKEIVKEIRHFKKYNKRENIYFHTDAVQAANYLDLDVERLGVDFLSLSGSKIENAGRIGILFKKKSASMENIFGGGDQEFGMRPGTENLPAILKFVSALDSAQKVKDKEFKRLSTLRDYFVKKLISLNPRIIINGDMIRRLPNSINITIPNIPSDLLVIELSEHGIMVSAKSACKSGDGKASHVIKAINPNINEEDGSLRFSFGRATTKKEIDDTFNALSEILKKLKKWYD